MSRDTGSSRLLSLDAYRGFIMLAMASAGFDFAAMAERFPESRAWNFLGWQFQHVPWVGCAFWDLIQPAFMFMVGVSLAYSYAARAAQGQTYGQMLRHAAWRAAVLVLLGVFLESNKAGHTTWIFTNVLAQIGLGYVFLFLLWQRPVWVQATVAAIILLVVWLAFVSYPAPDSSFDKTTVGLPADWPEMFGLDRHFQKNTNVAHAFDVWFLNLFPRPQPFVFNKGGYATLNFVPSLATMIFGLLTGELLRGQRSSQSKLFLLAACGLAVVLLGALINFSGLCPLVKRIWTPSWTIFSTGWVLLMLAAFYGLIEVAGQRRWAWPLVIVGMNSIAMYVMSQLLSPWIVKTLEIHAGKNVFDFAGEAFAPVIQPTLVLLVLWLICWWLYRQRIFVKV